MSKIVGRNDPCPCGSGKKYKNCCMNKQNEKDEYAEKLSNAYARFYFVNKELLKKSNDLPYSEASFDDAFTFSLTSNFLSFIKVLLENNYLNPTSILNLRNSIECIALIMMKNYGGIEDCKLELFPEQYKIIEYNMYCDKKDLGLIVDFSEIEQAYIYAKDKFLKTGISNNKFRKIVRQRVPFLCDTNMNFNEILNKYFPESERLYEIVSLMVHPDYFNSYIDKNYLNKCIKIFIDFIISLSENYKMGDCFPYYKMKNTIFSFNIDVEDNYVLKLKTLIDQQCNEFKSLADEFYTVYKEKGFPYLFFYDVIEIIKDISSDCVMGLCENVKLKIKVIFEKFAIFDKLYFAADINEHVFRINLYKNHSLYKFNCICGKNSNNADELITKAYDLFCDYYKTQELDYEKFKQIYNNLSGFLIEKNGELPSLLGIVKNYIDKYVSLAIPEDRRQSDKQYLLTLYLESQAMSHASGYLYFANTGAWHDDINVLVIIDNMISYIIKRMRLFYDFADKDCSKNRKMAKKLKETEDNIYEICSKKRKIMTSIGRVDSPF